MVIDRRSPQTEETDMRREYIECKTRATAARRCPWAAAIAKVEGGYIAFESSSDYRVWRAQK